MELTSPTIRGAIETDDGATVLLEAHGYGYDVDGRFRFVGSATHTSEHPDYSELNLAICALEGEVREFDEQYEIVVDVSELVWEPLEP